MMQEMRVGDFDITHTIQSAQPLTFFGDEKSDGRGVVYAFGGSLVEVEQHGSRLGYEAFGNISAAKLRQEVLTRFRLNDDLKRIYGQIATDKFLREAVKKYRGLRVTKNDPWEATLCYVISQFNNVKRIRGIVKNLVAAYGEQHTITRGDVRLSFRAFPTPDALARSSVKELMRHGAGFRAKYIRSVALACRDSFELDRLSGLDYDSAKRELMTLDGVGDKVADCILLFGCGKLEAFPVDTWIQRIVERVYFNGRKKSVRQIHEFAERKWGPDAAGYAQQYLFWAGRSLGTRR